MRRRGLMIAPAMRFVVAIALATLSGVSPRTAAQELPEDLLITLERTSCFGPCPVYSVSIDARGNVTYEGRTSVRAAGRRTTQVPVSGIAALLATAERIGFFDLKDRYETLRAADGTEWTMTDHPTAIVSITRAGGTKRVVDYLGAPPGLKELEKQIDEAAGTRRWVRVDVPTLNEMVQGGWSPTAGELGLLLRDALLADEMDVVKRLIELGADPNGDIHGMRPLMMVASADAARALMAAGASPFLSGQERMTALGAAVTARAREVVEMFLNAGVPADEPLDSEGRTPLFDAACGGHVAIVELLLRAGAEPSVRLNGISAVECARMQKDAPPVLAPFPGEPDFTRDLDRVIMLLEEATAARGRR